MQTILILSFILIVTLSPVSIKPSTIGIPLQNITTQNAGTLTGNLNVSGVTQLQNGGSINESGEL